MTRNLQALMNDPVWRCRKVQVQNLHRKLINLMGDEEDKKFMNEEFMHMLENYSLEEIELCFKNMLICLEIYQRSHFV